MSRAFTTPADPAASVLAPPLASLPAASASPDADAAIAPDASASARPSFIITMQNGQLVATVAAPVSSAWRVRSALIRVPRVSSIHIRPPPAPQQNEFLPFFSISRSSSPGTAPRTSRGAATTPL